MGKEVTLTVQKGKSVNGYLSISVTVNNNLHANGENSPNKSLN